MSSPRFEVILDPDALKEYNKLDNSVVEIAHKRYKFLKALSKPSLVEYLKRQLNWRNREKK
ncbi:MAG: hypothetical protein ACYC21_04155 [Eubacteriales bacterium]